MLLRRRFPLWFPTMVLLVGAEGSTISAREFGNAINVAGRQRMLTQRMSKEFLLIATGYNVAKTKGDLLGSISLFEGSLEKLIVGSAADGIPAAPSLALVELRMVEGLWAGFKAVLEGNMNKSPVPLDAISYVMGNNVPLLKQANVAVSRFVDAAISAGVSTAGMQVDTAGRQRMLSQKMSKEAVAIALGHDVAANVKQLRSTMDLFAYSHIGLLRGERFLDFPGTRNMCVLQQMRVVSDHWAAFQLVLQPILSDARVEEGRLRDLAELSPVLLREMNDAVTLYVTKPSDCPADFSEGDWLRALRDVSHSQHTAWRCGRLFLQIASGVDVAASATLLQSCFADVETSVRMVIEGSIVAQMRSPPTQAIADRLIDAWDSWATYEDKVDYSVTHLPVTLVHIKQSLPYSEVTYAKVREGLSAYLQAAAAAMPSLPTGVASLASKLGVAVEEMVLEAMMGHFTHDLSSGIRVTQAVATFTLAQRELLLGRPAAAGMEALNRTTEVCLLRHMQTVGALWDPLAACAARFAASPASSAELHDLGEHASRLYEPLRTAVDLYLIGSQGCQLQATDPEWEALLRSSSRLTALSEIVFSELALESRGVRPPWSSTRLNAVLAEINTTLDNLTFGSPSSGLPSPPTQAIADQLIRLRDLWAARAQGAGPGRRLAAAVTASTELVWETEILKSLYVRASNASASKVSAERIIAAARQWALVERLVRLAAELEPGKAWAVDALRQSIVDFEAAHDRLISGTTDILPGQLGYMPATTEQLILPQMLRVKDLLEPVKAQVSAVADAGYASDAALMQLSLDVRGLAVEVEAAARLYGTASMLSQVDVAQIIVPLPITGSWAPGGIMRIAATLAQDIINQQQRILPGTALKATFIDDHCDEREGMRGLLGQIVGNTSWLGLGGMACSAVCASTAIVASAVRLPAISYGCSGAYLSDNTTYPGFARLGTPLTAAAKLFLAMATKFGWTRLEVISDSSNYHPQDAGALVSDLRQGGLQADWQTTSGSNWHQLAQKAQLVLGMKHRQVIVLGDEFFVRNVVCAFMVSGVTKGVAWMSSGPKRRGWIQEDDPRVLANDASCTGAALRDYMQGTLNIVGSGMARPSMMNEPLDCLQGYTSKSFLELVERKWKTMQPSAEYGSLDMYDGLAGLAADGTCTFAYALQHVMRQGYTMQQVKRRDQSVYDETLRYLQSGLSFMGVSGNTSFVGNDRPGDLGMWQYFGNSSTEVGIELPDGTVHLDLHGGPSDIAWTPHPPEPPPYRFPVMVLPVSAVVLAVCTACFAGGWHGLKQSKNSRDKVESPIV